MSTKPQKPYADKVKESVHLLKQLHKMKITSMNIGYTELKGHMDKWLKDDEEFEGYVDFPQHYRRAHLSLSNMNSKTANIHLKHHEFSSKE
jgi:hypothetical protein